MGDMGDLYNEMHADWKQSRAQKREAAPRDLRELGVEFTSHNEGCHLILKVGRARIDFWPGTGRWRVFKTPLQGFGWRSLRLLIVADKMEQDARMQNG